MQHGLYTKRVQAIINAVYNLSNLTQNFMDESFHFKFGREVGEQKEA